MSTRRFALILGLVFVALGVAGFVPLLSSPPESGDMGSHPMLLGLFPVNPLHNAVHLLFGFWGVAAARSATGALLYARAVAILYGLLAVAGLVPGLLTGFGLIPLYAKDVWLHGLLALTGAYFGWVNRDPTGPGPE